MQLKRIYVEKKDGFQVEANALFHDLRNNLGIKGLKKVRIIDRYDVEGIGEEEYLKARDIVFYKPMVEYLYEEEPPVEPGQLVFGVELLPGQYDQRADSIAQCIQILTCKDKPVVKAAKLIVLSGNVSDDEFKKIKDYYINPIESRETSEEVPVSLESKPESSQDVKILSGFINMNEEELIKFSNSMNLAMNLDDLKFCQEYFRDTEKRDPSITEIKVIDTYWSDHCRHTTFLTGFRQVVFEEGHYFQKIKEAYDKYQEMRRYVYDVTPKKECLMDIATIVMKQMKKQGLLDDLDESSEINACSIKVQVDVDGEKEDWLVMFKNETHNHPTEIEPFGGAATCLGGAIRDPLSGRVYVYQAMRVTGSGDPRTPIEKTIPGKLPQRKITTTAAEGYSSYGNQVGVAAGQVVELYHPGYVAKRMELGAVVGAAPQKNVVRCEPQPGDVVILLGGRTGRDGCGGATGSSKAQDEESLFTAGAEVQRGNPPLERNILRLFRNSEITRLIKKCNDFGAGGVSVAIGELADGLDINLDKVPTKYEGLDGTELAISESQERMAVVLASDDAETFIEAARNENLEATVVARVTDTNRLRMKWRGSYIVDISRDFLNTNGIEQYADVIVESPEKEKNYFKKHDISSPLLKDKWISHLQSLNICGQRGLVERFDSTVGASTVLLPLGGKHQLTPAEGMASKVPVLKGNTNTATLMAFGFNPHLSSWSPFHGAVYAVIEAIAKITAMGGDYRKVRLSLQEYFEKLGHDPRKWGKPLAALLGALYAQEKLGIPAVGGKDSMSGTFEDLNVPPTLVAFAIVTADARCIISPEFKSTDSTLILLPLERDEYDLPNFDQLEKNYALVYELIQKGKILAAHSVRGGGIAEAVSKMCFGNGIGFMFRPVDPEFLFQPLYGSLLLEVPNDVDIDKQFSGIPYQVLGTTQKNEVITVGGEEISLKAVLRAWDSTLEPIFPTKPDGEIQDIKLSSLYDKPNKQRPLISNAAPRVFIPIFPGANSEQDFIRAFESAGGVSDLLVMRNLTSEEIQEALREMAKRIRNSQILMLPSGGDMPDGSGKFVAAAMRNPAVQDAIMDLLHHRQGLILGIGDGFKALLKSGLLPYGEFREPDSDSPVLTYNTIGRHVSRMVQTRVVSMLSPWLALTELGEIHTIPVSHEEGRFIASPELLRELMINGQISTQYVDMDGNPTALFPYNPSGSMMAVEGITSPDGRVFGKMGHSERTVMMNIGINVPGNKDQRLFESGISYFK